ncbi:homeodomain-interacting protein kinase 2-like [Thalassophryne amazonica]|uniref:homeodomain-interacting protein kinase 2-like n=1 Tax=Thalassophryne amazonica TaxID=390379 RepID=UPI001471050D|nr:homeodomain-interacting protein kinase 2-like [Thalassophryne amazonica]
MKFIVDTQGLPPDRLLRLGPHTNHCFERWCINSQDTWTLKTPALIQVQTGHKFSGTRAVVLTCLEDIMEMMDTNTIEKEGHEFVDLLKRMMCLDNEQWIRPLNVLQHPFMEEDSLETEVEDEPLVWAEENQDLTEDLTPIIQEEAEEPAAIQCEAQAETRTTWRRHLTQAFRRMFCLC